MGATAAINISSSRQRENILCFSSIDWDFVWQGHQEIMSTLARQGHRVLFVENTGVRNPRFRDISRIRYRLAKWRESTQGFWQVEENLYVFSPLVLPFPYSHLARRINRWLILLALKRWMDVMKFHEPICWTFLPTPLTLDVIRRLTTKALIYYCIDSFADSTPAARRILTSERDLFRRADLIFVTSKLLFHEASRYSNQVHLFPFGVSFGAFKKAQSLTEGPPGDLKALKRPIVGYVGGIHQWVDQELLCRVAQAHRAYSFVLVGPVQTDVGKLQREPNIFLLGQKPHSKLGHYIKYFDVGIIPYRLTDYTKNVYPTKLNEYHAMGKPVVSTPLAEVLVFNSRYKNLIRIGSQAAEFEQCIEEALQEGIEARRQSRIAAARENSWDRRIELMQNLIQEVALRKSIAAAKDWTGRFSASLRASRKLLLITLSAALGVGLLFNTPMVWLFARPLVVSTPLEHADAIVVFAGGVGESGRAAESYQERTQQAVELYKHGIAPRILFVSGYTLTFQEADIMRLLAESLGVPEEAILTEKQVHQTYDYVLRVREWCHEHRWKSILLVTSPYHTRRAALTFTRNVPGLKVVLAPWWESSYYEHTRGITPRQLGSLLHEVLSIGFYWFKGWI